MAVVSGSWPRRWWAGGAGLVQSTCGPASQPVGALSRWLGGRADGWRGGGAAGGRGAGGLRGSGAAAQGPTGRHPLADPLPPLTPVVSTPPHPLAACLDAIPGPSPSRQHPPPRSCRDDETGEPTRLVGFDLAEPTARNQGKPQAIAMIRQRCPYNTVGGRVGVTWHRPLHTPEPTFLCGRPHPPPSIIQHAPGGVWRGRPHPPPHPWRGADRTGPGRREEKRAVYGSV